MKTQDINLAPLETSMENAVQLTQPVKRFVETLKQSLLALLFILGSLLAGSMFVIFSSIFFSAAWILIVYPSILSMRGVIGGLFCGRLSTGLHLGTVKPSLTKNTKSFYLLLYSTITLTLQSSLMIGGMASLLSVFIWGTQLSEIVSILSVVIATMSLSLVLISPGTLVVSVIAFKYGLNPDIIVYPVMSTLADILTTLCFLLTLGLHFFWGNIGSYIIGLLDLVFLFLVFYILLKSKNEREFTLTMKEFFLTLVAVTIIVSITGNTLGRISEVIGSRQEIYFIYPSLISTIGAVGSIVGSNITTKLALGMVKPSFTAVKQNIPEIGGACVSSTIFFVFLAAISSSLTQGTIVFKEILRQIAMLSTVNLLAAPIMSAIAYNVAVLTYKRGLNPDNFVIPFVSSLSDSVTTIFLLVAINLFGGL